MGVPTLFNATSFFPHRTRPSAYAGDEVLLAGRPSLAGTLERLRGQQWHAGDVGRLVSDGPNELAAELWKKAAAEEFPLRHLVLTDGPHRHRDWGHTPRNRTMRLAQGDYLIHIDDDDDTPHATAQGSGQRRSAHC